MKIGIPRALLYYRYGIFWETFFQKLGHETVLSPRTNKDILTKGEQLSIDENCLSTKLFFGHVAALEGKCDYCFVPRIANLGDAGRFCSRFEALPDMGPVHTVSIIPTGSSAAGYTMPLPSESQIHYTKGRLMQHIMASMGGRIAEELILDDYTTGASQDIKDATKIARDMVMKYGMSEKIGFINYEQQQEEVFLGRDLGHIKTYGNQVYDEIEAEVKRIIDECYTNAKKIIEDRRDVLERGAALLLEREKISQKEFEAVYYQTEAAE